MSFRTSGIHAWACPLDALLEAAAGADVSVDLCHAPEFTLKQRLPQQGKCSAFWGVPYSPFTEQRDGCRPKWISTMVLLISDDECC